MGDKNYLNVLNEIKERIRSSQYESLKAVNKELINLYLYMVIRLLNSRRNIVGENQS